MALHDLPNELLLLIAEYLVSPRAVARTNVCFYTLFNIYLYRYNVKHDKGSAHDWAAQKGQEATARMAIAAREGANVQPHNWTPLAWAASAGHKDVKFGGDTAVSLAAARGHEAVVELLFAAGADPDLQVDLGADTLQLLAACRGREGIVQMLLATGNVDVNFRNFWSATPLSLAASNGHEAVVKLLLCAPGVDPDVKDDSGNAPLSLAASSGHEGIVELLLATNNVDVNSRNYDGGTALTFAAWNGHEAVVKLLLAAGIDPDLSTAHGVSPLSLAAARGHEGIVELLLATGKVDVHSRNCWGNTPLLLAASEREGRAIGNEYQTIVELLLAAGADLESKDNVGGTPLSLAAIRGSWTMVKLLLGIEGVDVGSQDRTGATPLALAVRYRPEEVVKLLLAAGADPELGRLSGVHILAMDERVARNCPRRDGTRRMVKRYLVRWARQKAKKDQWLYREDLVGYEEFLKGFEDQAVKEQE